MRGNALLILSGLVAMSGSVVSARPQASQPAATGQTISADAETRVTPADESGQPGDDKQEPGLKGWISRRIDDLDSPTRQDPKHFSAFGGIIVAGSGLAAGVGYERQNVIKDRIDYQLEAMYSVRRYQRYRAAIGMLDNRGSTLEFDTSDSSVPSLFNASAGKASGSALYLDTRFRDYPRHLFYGLGSGSGQGNEADYTLRGVSIEGVWQWQIAPALGLSARGGWLDLDVDAGHDGSVINLEDRFPLATLPGAVELPGFVTFGLGLAHDTRSAPGGPEDGRMIGASIRHFAARNASALSFTRLTAEARAYQRPFTNRGVIAVRALVSTDLTGDQGRTPFYLQATLGGSETLRGYHSYRFRDQAMVHGTVEYRWRVHRFVELAPFFDAGTVAPGLSRLGDGSLKTSQGIGFRVRTDRRALGRLDWGWSEEGHRIVFGVGPAF